jgi:cell wall-associated NlpC family hydrolase
LPYFIGIISENSYNLAIVHNMIRLKKIFFAFLFICFSTITWSQKPEGATIKPPDAALPTFNNQNSEKINSIIAFAKTFIGTPYHWGGTTPSGFDCSGFINYIFGNFGFSLTRTSYNLAELGETVKLENLQPGDLLFFRGTRS